LTRAARAISPLQGSACLRVKQDDPSATERVRPEDAPAPPLHRRDEVCHLVHMRVISIRELYLETGRWVRHAATRGPIVVTDRGRRVAALQPFDRLLTARPLPDREARIRKRSRIPVDSSVYQDELRQRG
jgi:antitoxin (DNA-binding transcriptional repressor) of toxin-antitoxin stability system